MGPHGFLEAVFKLCLGKVFVVLLNRVVGEMSKLVCYFGLVVVLDAKATVELSVHPNFGRIVIFDQDPLSNVEFFLLDD